MLRLIYRIFFLVLAISIIFNQAPNFYALAEDPSQFPMKPVMAIVGYSAGGSTDMSFRALATVASKDLGQAIMVENKAGAGSSLALGYLVGKEPDGYSIGLLATGGLINQHMRKVPYDTDKDFTPIMLYAQFQAGLVVRSDAKWKTFKEFIDYAKSKPGAIRYSTAGIGTQQHLVMTRLGKQLGIQWKHIPYKDGPAAIFSVERGDVEATSQTAEWVSAVKEGRLRLLAVYTETRLSEFPDVPTLMEMGYGITAPSMLGIVGPKGLNQTIVERLHKAFKKAMNDEQFLKVSQNFGLKVFYKSPGDFGKFIAEMNKTWAPIIRQAGMEMQ